MQDKPYRVALIGCQDIVFNYVFNGIKGLPLRMCAIATQKQRELERFSNIYATGNVYDNYREMLFREKPDIVISFPDDDSEQFACARDSLQSGAWVVSQRPVSKNPAELDELIALQNAVKRYVIPRYNRRYMPAYVMAAEIARRREFGENRIFYLKFHAADYVNESEYIWDHMSHLLDTARFILGECRLESLQRVFVSEPRLVYNLQLKSDSGCIGSIQASATVCNNYPVERLELHGDQNGIVIENQIDLQYNRAIENKFDINTGIRLSEGNFGLRWNPNTNHLFNYSIDGMENLFRHLIFCMDNQLKPAQEISDFKKTAELTLELQRLAAQA